MAAEGFETNTTPSVAIEDAFSCMGVLMNVRVTDVICIFGRARQVMRSSACGIILMSLNLFAIAGCKGSVSARPIGATVRITPPLGLLPVPIPRENPPTAQTIVLERIIYCCIGWGGSLNQAWASLGGWLGVVLRWPDRELGRFWPWRSGVAA